MSDRFELLRQQISAARRSMADADAERHLGKFRPDASGTEDARPAPRLDLATALGIDPPPLATAAAPAPASPDEEEQALLDLRRQASLTTWFAFEDLATPGVTDSARAGAVTRLIDDCERHPETGRFMLGAEARRRELARLESSGQLPRAGAAARPEGGRLEQLYQQLLSGKRIATARMKAEDLGLVQQAAAWVQGILPNAPDPRQLHAQRAEKGFLKELQPLLADGFYGRRNELRQLQAFCANGGPACGLAVITGLGGSGKSTLIVRFMNDLRKRESPPLIGWLDFDRASLNPAAPHLLSFEVSRQIGLQIPAAAEALRRRRDQIRQEESLTDSFRSRGAESISESRDKGSYEMNVEIAQQLALSPQHANALVLVLDTMEEISRRGRLIVDAVLRWAEGLAEILKQHRSGFATFVLVSGRLYDAQLNDVMAPRHGFGPPMLLTLPPLDLQAARMLLRRQGVTKPMAERILRSGAPLHPLPLLLIAQLGREEPDLDLEAIVRDVEALPERDRSERFSALVYWRYLARIRDPAVQILAHPGLVLRRVSPEDIRAILIPALSATAAAAGAAVAGLQHAISGAGEEDAPDRRPPREIARGLAALGEAGFGDATASAAAQPELGRLTQFTGATGLKALQRFLQIDEFAAVLAGLDAAALDDVYARLISYAWLVEARSDGAWHRSDLRRLLIREMVAQMPAVARAIQERAADHYASREPAEAMYHRLVLARTAEDCDRLDRDAVRSAVSAIERDASDFPPAAQAFFGFVAKGTAEPGAVHLLPLPERASAFATSGEQLVRLGRFEEAGRLMAARPPSAPLGPWEILTRYALVQWPELAHIDAIALGANASAVDKHFLLHHRGFAKFLQGDMPGASADFEHAIRTVRTSDFSQQIFLPLRTLVYQIVVHRSDSSPMLLLELEEILPKSSHRENEKVLKEGLEWPRFFALNAEGKQLDFLAGLRYQRNAGPRIAIDVLPIDAALVMEARDDMFIAGDPGTGFVVATQGEVARICREAKTVHEVLRQFNGLRRRKDLLIGRAVRLDLTSTDYRRLQPLLRGPDPEFRDPLRTALARAFASRGDAETLAGIASDALPFNLDSLDPSFFVDKYIADPQDTLLSLVELLDRARVLGKVIDLARRAKPNVRELMLLDEGYFRWNQAFAQARPLR